MLLPVVEQTWARVLARFTTWYANQVKSCLLPLLGAEERWHCFCIFVFAENWDGCPLFSPFNGSQRVKPKQHPLWVFPWINASQRPYSAGLARAGLLNFQEFCDPALKLLRVWNHSWRGICASRKQKIGECCEAVKLLVKHIPENHHQGPLTASNTSLTLLTESQK